MWVHEQAVNWTRAAAGEMEGGKRILMKRWAEDFQNSELD